MQASRHRCHCLTALSMTNWSSGWNEVWFIWYCSQRLDWHKLYITYRNYNSSIKNDFSLVTSWIRLWYTCSCSFPRSGSLLGWGHDRWLTELQLCILVFCGLTAAWSYAPYWQEHCPVRKHHSRPLSAIINVTDTGTFCCQYLKSTVK